MFLKRTKYFLPLALLPFFVCEDFFFVLRCLFFLLPSVLCTYIAIFSTSASHPCVCRTLNPPYLFQRFLNFSSVGWGVWYMETQISDIFILPAFLVPSMYYLVCFLIRGVKMSSSINCQLTDAVCSHDQVPNWPSIVF